LLLAGKWFEVDQMKIGILSDTHDQRARTKVAISRLVDLGVEAIFHCGDLVSSDLIDLCAVVPMYYVFGNNDEYFADEIRSAIESNPAVTCLESGGEIVIDGKRIGITHGHMMGEQRRILSNRPDYFFFGHSHIAADTLSGGTRRINPGALHRAREYSVAVLDLSKDELTFLPIEKSIGESGNRD
jgi:putative phosphoesterase